MLELEQDIKSGVETYEGCLVKVEEHGNESLRKIIRRQDSENPPNPAEVTKIEEQNGSKGFHLT